MPLLRQYFGDLRKVGCLLSLLFLLVLVMSFLTTMDIIGPAELKKFSDAESGDEEQAATKAAYEKAEADSVQTGWEESRREAERRNDPYRDTAPGKGDAEWRYRVPWEIFAALDRASDASPGETPSVGFMSDLRPKYRWGSFQEAWSRTCTDEKGRVSHDSGSEDRVLLVGADFWAGHTTITWKYKSETRESGSCSYYHSYPVPDHKEYQPEWSRLEGVMSRLDHQPDSLGQVLEIADIYGESKWFALLEGTEFLPDSATSPVGPLIRNLYESYAAQLPNTAPPITIPKGGITSPFGPREHPVLGGVSFHHGVDFASYEGEPVKAAASGVVLYAGWMGAYGQAVIVAHGGGVATLYAHMSSVEVQTGQRIADGDTIGLVGSTGLSTGPHLHFEVRVDGEARDPIEFR